VAAPCDKLATVELSWW